MVAKGSKLFSVALHIVIVIAISLVPPVPTLPSTSQEVSADWQNHSIRGFLSGQVTKKMGLKMESTKSESGERTYRIA